MNILCEHVKVCIYQYRNNEMNLHKLAWFVVFLWLPLVASDLQGISNLFSNKRTITSVNDEKNLTESIPAEENSLEMQKNKLISSFIGSNASGNLTNKTSANRFNSKSGLNTYREVNNHANAHKYKGSLKKDPSALNSSKNASATFKRLPNSKTNNMKSKIRKRNAAIEISVGEDPHSPDDYEEEEAEDIEIGNSSGIGSYVGAPCELTCSKKLVHVFCDPRNKVCECEDKYPVQIGPGTGCEKPKLLGDQCFYAQTCSFFDSNAVCMQIDHNAMCQCKPGFHAVALRKGVKRMFCSEDVAVVSADLSTLLGVATGIAILTGLICFVLRLFNGNRYPNTRHFANSNIAPPLLLSSDNQWINGIPLTVHGRPSSRASCQRSTMSLAQQGRSKGVLVPASRAGAARAAAILLIPCHLQARHSEVISSNSKDDAEVQLNDVERSSRLGSRRQSFSSVHSTTSSQKSMSYSARRFEQENQQREQRVAMRAAREEAAKTAASFTPSPMSTNGILMPFSKDTEEDPLCADTQDPPPVSEPPAFSVAQSVMAPKTSPH